MSEIFILEATLFIIVYYVLFLLFINYLGINSVYHTNVKCVLYVKSFIIAFGT